MIALGGDGGEVQTELIGSEADGMNPRFADHPPTAIKPESNEMPAAIPQPSAKLCLRKLRYSFGTGHHRGEPEAIICGLNVYPLGAATIERHADGISLDR